MYVAMCSLVMCVLLVTTVKRVLLCVPSIVYFTVKPMIQTFLETYKTRIISVHKVMYVTMCSQ